MSVLYLTEQGAVLRKRGETLVVEKDGAPLAEVELHRLEAILVFGNIQVSTQALAELLDAGIELAFLTQHGKLRGQLTPPYPRNITLRIQQYRGAQDPDFVLRQARLIVQSKLENCRMLIQQADWDSAALDFGAERERFAAAVEQVPQAGDLDALNGVEGAAAAVYFGILPLLVKAAQELGFSGRNRHPPRDPVNALLSLGYTLLASRLQSLLDAVGLDPYLGLLHRPAYGRPSLALDLLEPYRAPVVDRFTIRSFNLKIFGAEDFTADDTDGVRLRPDALKRYFGKWEQHITEIGLTSLMRNQVESLMRVFKGEQREPDHPVFRVR